MIMSKAARIDVDEIIAHFSELEDPRSPINRRHPLESVVVLALMGILAGARGPSGIADWARTKSDFLQRALPLPAGVPCKDVFRRVLMLLNPSAFQACFLNWLESLRARAAEASGIDQPVFAIDGKTARRSHDHKSGLGALHSVSVWAGEFGLTLGQVACAEKSNEITAIPELLHRVDVKGAIITIDAMGTQKAIAEQIVDRGADYVLALKGNQENLHGAVIDHVEKHLENDFADVPVRRLLTSETGHGREEVRSYIQLSVPSDLADSGLWKGLKTIGVVVSACVRDGKETIEKRYYISSLPLGVKNFARAVRGHWGIENTCHGSLDYTFREDESRIREKNLRENFAWINRFLLSLLKQHPAKKSLVMKRMNCAWDEDFLLQVLAGSTA
jgi:predicted transposase YbfD/YdcC